MFSAAYRLLFAPEKISCSEAASFCLMGFVLLTLLHLACAESARCDYFVTCDDQLQAVASRAGARIHVQVVGPLFLAARLKREEGS